jgi:hypothetical protein
MAKISTDLGVNIAISDVPASRGIEAKISPAPTGKDSFTALSEALGSLNPKIYELAKQGADRQNEQDAVLGANTVNGMTLEEARKAHQDGFPDIYNGWARVGAYKQYANNANEEFARTWKQKYLENRGDPNYNWEQDYKIATQAYLQDKQNDPFFQEAFRKETNKTKDWIREKEFEFQNAELQNRVQTDTAYSIATLPDKVIDKLDADFRSTIPINESGKDFASKKEEYIKTNFEKEFIKQFYDLKASRNPALTNLDFDKLLVKQANFHALTGGDYAGVFTTLLTEKRPDGTPPVLMNPKLENEALQALTNLSKALKVLDFESKYYNGDISNFDNAELKTLQNDLFQKTLTKYKKRYGDNIEAWDSTFQQLSPTFAKNPPIPELQQLLNRPLSSTYNLDTQKAFALALRLDEQGALSRYFDANENSKDAMKWYMAVQLFRSGQNKQDIIKTLSELEQTKKLTSLDNKDRTELANQFSGSLKNIYNRDLIYNVASYFKSLDKDGTNYVDSTKTFIKKYYFEDKAGVLISRNKLLSLGIEETNYDAFKNEVINYMKGIQYVPDKDKIKEPKTYGDFNRDKFNKELFKNNPEANPGNLAGYKVDFSDYDFAVNPDRKTAWFTEKNGVNYYQPVLIEKTVGYRQDGSPIKETKRLEIDLKPFLEKMNAENKLKVSDNERKNYELSKKRSETIQEINKYRLIPMITNAFIK